MARAFAAALILLGTAMPALPKALCPPGRLTIRTVEPAAPPSLDGMELVLGRGRAALADRCTAVRAGQFHRLHGAWLSKVRARWRRCDGPRLAMRARWDFTAAYCTRLVGVLRSARGPWTAFVADRIPECGNGLRESGEQCDGQAGTLFATDCCAADCRVKAGCPTLCDHDFPCGQAELCAYGCGGFGFCRARAAIDCGDAPVCGCDGSTTYADRCAAYEAGTGVSAPRACPAG